MNAGVHHDTDSCQLAACRFSAASIALYMLQGYLPWVDAVARVIQPEVYQQRAECLMDSCEVSAHFQPVCNGFAMCADACQTHSGRYSAKCFQCGFVLRLA